MLYATVSIKAFLKFSIKTLWLTWNVTKRCFDEDYTIFVKIAALMNKYKQKFYQLLLPFPKTKHNLKQNNHISKSGVSLI